MLLPTAVYQVRFVPRTQTTCINNSSFYNSLQDLTYSHWSWSTKLLYTGPGYYLDGWPSVDR